MMTARVRNSASALLSILCCFVISPPAITFAQVSITRTPDPAPVLSDRAKSQLQSRLESVAATPLQIVDVDGAPVQVIGPRATSIRIEGNCDPPPDPGAIINDYAMKLRFRLVNRTDRRVTGVGLEFTNTHENNRFYIYPGPIEIEPGKGKRVDLLFMTVTGDPAYLSVQLVGARFGDDTTWGGFPFPKPGRLLAPVPSAVAPTDVAPQVDSKPKLLNSSHPRYTEEARRNHVLGTANLRLLVGNDGAVKQIKVTNALPDGLTEQAILAANQLKFEPAKKNGEPVAYWIPVQIDFNLK